MSSTHHISSQKQLLMVAIGLLILTVITILLAQIHIAPPFNIIIALFIAVIKMSLVVAFFMNLYWDNRLYILIFLMGIAFFILFIGITLLDTLFRETPILSF